MKMVKYHPPIQTQEIVMNTL